MSISHMAGSVYVTIIAKLKFELADIETATSTLFIMSRNHSCIVICYTYTHIHAEYILTQWIKTSDDFFKKKYTSYFIWKGCVCERQLETNRTATYWPPLLWPSALCLSRFPDVQPEAQGSAFCWLSLPHLVTNSSDLQLNDILSLPSYIIVQSPTQSFEWHVRSSSSGNNCHAVHWSLSSGASVYECTMRFYLVPYCQQSPPTRFLVITAIGMCHFLSVHHFGIACLAGSKVNIQHHHLYFKYDFRLSINCV